MTDVNPAPYEESIVVDVPAEALYDLVSDVTRTGEWSPVCKECWWDDGELAGEVGAWFTGRNELPERTWETRSQVVAADRPHEFAWIVGDAFVRWGFVLTPADAGVTLTETWHFLPAGIEMFGRRYGDQARAEIRARTEMAHTGIPKTLGAIKRVAESELRGSSASG
jgi:hypothetical protein